MINLKELYFPDYDLYSLTIRLSYLLDWVEESNLDLNPDYQRNTVWKEKQQKKYIEYFILGGLTGVLYFNHSNFISGNKDIPLEIVDGKQRITSLIKFVKNEITVFDNVNGGKVYYKDIKDQINMTRCPIKISINGLKDRVSILQWYIDLNRGGTMHTDEEIEKVENMIKELKEVK